MPSASPSRWPRLLDIVDAAEYCGVSVNHFKAHVPVTPILLGTRKLWDRKAIDQWLDGGPGGARMPTIKEMLDRA